MPKPLFVPLKAEYFTEFERGTKSTEYRLYGPRWNEKTCYCGRPVVLSLGYGTKKRLRGRITGLVVEPLACLRSDVRRELCALFTLEPGYQKIACINIEIQS